MRAANHLRSLGKGKAVAALREFARIARRPGYGGDIQIDPKNIDTSNEWCLATLVPLVFEPADPNGPKVLWPEDCITVWEGIPFHNVVINGTSGSPPSMAPLVEWADLRGKVIEKPLRPTDHPLEAADGLLRQLAREGNEQARDPEGDLRRHLRFQAWRMAGPLVEPDRKKARDRFDQAFRSDEKWARLKAEAARLDLHWDEQRQEYVAGRKAESGDRR